MTRAADWGFTYIVAWHPDGRWVGWFHDLRRDEWRYAEAGRGTYVGNSEQLHRRALVEPPKIGLQP